MAHIHITFRFEDLSKDALVHVAKTQLRMAELADKVIDAAYELFTMTPSMDGYNFGSKEALEEYHAAQEAFLEAHNNLVEAQQSINTEKVNDR